MGAQLPNKEIYYQQESLHHIFWGFTVCCISICSCNLLVLFPSIYGSPCKFIQDLLKVQGRSHHNVWCILYSQPPIVSHVWHQLPLYFPPILASHFTTHLCLIFYRVTYVWGSLIVNWLLIQLVCSFSSFPELEPGSRLAISTQPHHSDLNGNMIDAKGREAKDTMVNVNMTNSIQQDQMVLLLMTQKIQAKMTNIWKLKRIVSTKLHLLCFILIEKAIAWMSIMALMWVIYQSTA